MPPGQADHAFFSRRTRRQIERLACRTPASVDWELTHWSQRSLAQIAVDRELVESIAPVTIGQILHEADLPIHQWRWWKTTIWDEEAVNRAVKILWYYERFDSLWQRGEVVLALDEAPNLQVLERNHSTQLVRPGQPERQEFTYHRHGTINVLAGLTLHTGHMWSECLDKNDGEHFRPALTRCLHAYAFVHRKQVLRQIR